MYLLGYDIGSSALKAAIVEAESHKVIAFASYPETEMDMISRQSGWAEQSPERWWQNLCILTQRLLAKSGIKNTDIKAIGIGYQMHGLVVVDQNNQVLRPAIIWCDSRAVAIGNEAFHAIGASHCLHTFLNSPGNFTASKLKWLKDNEPDTYRRIKKIMLPGDYIAMKLTGQIATTVPGLSEAILWNFKEHKVAQEVLDYYGFSSDILPEIVPVFSLQGKLTREAAEMTGLYTGLPVTYRAGDQPNNALALNVLHPGEVAATGGTSGVVYGVVDKLIFDEKARINSFAHVNHTDEQPRIGVLLCINGAGMLYSWMRQQVAENGIQYPEMERLAAEIAPGSDDLRILPFGNGAERLFSNQNLGAQILNLHFNRHRRAHFYRAALEGVAFSFVYGMKVLQELGLNVSVLRVGNDNLFQSAIFSSTISNLMKCRIELLHTTGATGAAIAAGVGIGLWNAVDEGLGTLETVKIYEPQTSENGQFADIYSDWESRLEKSQ